MVLAEEPLPTCETPPNNNTHFLEHLPKYITAFSTNFGSGVGAGTPARTGVAGAIAGARAKAEQEQQQEWGRSESVSTNPLNSDNRAKSPNIQHML